MDYKHEFKEGGALSIVDSYYAPVNRKVPTIFFKFKDGNKFKTVGAALMDGSIDLLPEISRAMDEELNKGKELKEQEDEKTEKLKKFLKQKKCQCGTTYTPTSGNQKLCPKCKEKK